MKVMGGGEIVRQLRRRPMGHAQQLAHLIINAEHLCRYADVYLVHVVVSLGFCSMCFLECNLHRLSCMKMGQREKKNSRRHRGNIKEMERN